MISVTAVDAHSRLGRIAANIVRVGGAVLEKFRARLMVGGAVVGGEPARTNKTSVFQATADRLREIILVDDMPPKGRGVFI